MSDNHDVLYIWQMAVPQYEHLVEPLLRFLATQSRAATPPEAHEAIAVALRFTPEQRAERMADGKLITYKYRLNWAHDRLKRAGLSVCPLRGQWLATEKGRSFAAANPSLSEEQIRTLTYTNWKAVRAAHTAVTTDESVAAGDGALGKDDLATTVAPQEQIQAALLEIRDTVARDLLETIGRCSPEFFEYLVLDVLHALGYGTETDSLKRVGGSSDGGIDGIIWLDKLGLEKVYVQAKRWRNAVGSPEVQTFLGALHFQGASKGVLLTTGRFTAEAVKLAERGNVRIALVDGARLAGLMIDYGVAVSHTAVKVPAIDNDYFDGE